MPSFLQKVAMSYTRGKTHIVAVSTLYKVTETPKLTKKTKEIYPLTLRKKTGCFVEGFSEKFLNSHYTDKKAAFVNPPENKKSRDRKQITFKKAVISFLPRPGGGLPTTPMSQ